MPEEVDFKNSRLIIDLLLHLPYYLSLQQLDIFLTSEFLKNVYDI